jgi:hypothetical protein
MRAKPIELGCQKPTYIEEAMMSNNFYSNDAMVKIRVEERMAEAAAYRRAIEVEQSNASKQPVDRIVFRPFGWIRQLVLRIGGAGA